MATPTLSVNRALRQPRRIDARAIFGLFLMLAALAGSIAFWTTSSDTQAVLIATRDLPAGATLRETDLTVAHVRLSPELYQSAIPEDELPALAGKQLAAPVYANQVLARKQISTRPVLASNQMVLALAVNPETALGGKLHAGDAVQILVTTNKGKPDEQTRVVLPRVTVYDVGYDDRVTAIVSDSSATTPPSGDIKWVSLIVTGEQGLRLTAAKWSGDVDVALLPPQP